MSDKTNKQYYCVFRKTKDSQAVSCSFDAEHTGRAIARVAELAEVKFASDLSSVELLEVRGRNYIPVFRRGDDINKPHIKLSADACDSGVCKTTPADKQAPAQLALVDKTDDPPKEAKPEAYTPPYTIEVL